MHTCYKIYGYFRFQLFTYCLSSLAHRITYAPLATIMTTLCWQWMIVKHSTDAQEESTYHFNEDNLCQVIQQSLYRKVMMRTRKRLRMVVWCYVSGLRAVSVVLFFCFICANYYLLKDLPPVNLSFVPILKMFVRMDRRTDEDHSYNPISEMRQGIIKGNS